MKRSFKTRFDGLSRGLRRKRGDMNKTESAYARYLDGLIAANEVNRYWFEPFSIRLSHPDSGQPLTVSPDFLVLLPDGRTYVDDVKGRMVDNASVARLKAAAELYPLWIFRLCTKAGAGWEIREL